jgi:hypothetical protein
MRVSAGMAPAGDRKENAMDDPQAPDDPSPPPRRRRGTEKRQATSMVSFRLLPPERAQVEARADAAGLSLGGYIRSLLLAAPLMRSRRRPSIQVLALARLLAELNKIGSNINQLARCANMGTIPDWPEIRAAQRDLHRAVEAILDALDRAPDREPEP